MTTATLSIAVPTRRTARVESVPAAQPAPAEKSLLQYLGLALGTSFLVLLLAVAVAVVGLPAALGGSAMTVLTKSMEPGLPPGTLVVVKPTPVDDIAVGDVITFQIRSGEAAVVSHRVIAKTYADGEVLFTTQGDNNPMPDAEQVRQVQVQGTVWYSLPLLGWANLLLTGQSRGIVLAVVAGALFLYALASTVGAARERIRRRPSGRATLSGAPSRHGGAFGNR